MVHIILKQTRLNYGKFKNWSIAASYIKINAFRDSKLLISGTLGEYKYYDMDQLIDRAIYLANKIPGKTLC
jgi:UDP-galactopyranose mutase